jgi:putative aldouronate transport system permease protein
MVAADPSFARNGRATGTGGRGALSARIHKYRILYLFLLPGAVLFILFSYLPMFGLTMVFQQYDPVSGFLGSKWVGLANFERLLASPVFVRAMRNTIVISLLKLAIEFPLPIIFSLLLNELRALLLKRTVQTISYLPNFVSWVIVAGLWYNMLAPESGIVNQLLVKLGVVKEGIFFMQSREWFYPVILFTDIWKNLGFQAIFYLGAIASIDPELYEAAVMDGAGRFRQAISITVPGIRNTIVLLFILSVSGLLNAGFDQMWTMGNLSVREIGDILDTAVLRTLTTGSVNDLSVGAAMGFFKASIGLVLFAVANTIASRLKQESVI